MSRFLLMAVLMAYANFVSAQPDSGGLDRRWALAQGHMASNQPRAALPYLEDLVTLAPSIAAFRLELGYALFLIEDDDRARFHFEQALGGNISENEKRSVSQILDRMDRRKNWELFLQFSLLPETNPTRRTAAETITIGGLEFVLDEVDGDGPATALVVGGGVGWTPSLTRDLKARLAFNVNGRLYKDGNRNDVSTRIETGLLSLADGGRLIGGGLSYQQRYLGDDIFSQGLGVYLTYQQRLTSRMQISGRLDRTKLTYPDLFQRDGMRTAGIFRLAYVVTPQMSLSGGILVAQTEAEAPSESGTEHALSLGLQYLFDGGLIATLDLRKSQDRRDGRTPLFVDPRKDERWNVVAGLRHRNFNIGGFAPTLEVGHERQQSNIGIYEYENTFMAIGLSRSF